MNVVRCRILCRTYREPKEFRNYASRDKSAYFFTASPNTTTKLFTMLDWTINLAWRWMNSTGYIFDERSWKTGVDATGQDDIYYNIEAEDVAISFALGVFGLMI